MNSVVNELSSLTPVRRVFFERSVKFIAFTAIVFFGYNTVAGMNIGMLAPLIPVALGLLVALWYRTFTRKSAYWKLYRKHKRMADFSGIGTGSYTDSPLAVRPMIYAHIRAGITLGVVFVSLGDAAVIYWLVLGTANLLALLDLPYVEYINNLWPIVWPVGFIVSWILAYKGNREIRGGSFQNTPLRPF